MNLPADEHDPLIAWQVCMLGGVRIYKHGIELPAPPYRSQALLAAVSLQLASGQRDLLTGLLFPDLPEKEARARLSDRLWLIKNSLPGIPLFVSATHIRLEPGQVSTDVAEFRELVARGDAASCAQAIHLYRGELLPELDEEWLILERENLYLQFTTALQTIAAHHLSTGKYFQAVPVLEQLIQHDPYDEGNVRNLLRAFQSTGQRGKALGLFDRFRLQLKQELDIEPDPATLALVDAIRSQVLPPLDTGITTNSSKDRKQQIRAVRTAIWRGEYCRPNLEWESAFRIQGTGESLQGRLFQIENAVLMGNYQHARRIIAPLLPSTDPDIQEQTIHLLAGERKYIDLIEIAGSALSAAHLKRDRLAETLILVNLGTAQQRTGNALEAMRCANQAITLAEKDALAYPLACGYCLKGALQGSQGFDRDAIETLHLARSHAEEQGFRPLLVKIERMLGTFYQQSGKYQDSLEQYSKALILARDLSLITEEAEILHNRAAVYASLGRNLQGIGDIEQAGLLWERIGDELGIARNLYHLAFSLAIEESPDFDRVFRISSRALQIFCRHQTLGWIASMHGMLGYVYWLHEEPARAIQECQEAIPIYQRLEEADYIPELYGYIGLAYLDLGEIEKGLESTRRALDEMMRGELYDIASEIYFAHGMALHASGQEADALHYFRLGYENLVQYAAEIQDPDAREAFFRRDPTVRRLMEQCVRFGLATPPTQVESPVHGSHHAPVIIKLTLDAGAPDQALKNAAGEVALRRERIRRLLKQSRLQGVEPSIQEIAALMRVSTRTVQRDLAVLSVKD